MKLCQYLAFGGFLSLCSLADVWAVNVKGKVEAFALNPARAFTLPFSGQASVTGPHPVKEAKITVTKGPSQWTGGTNATGNFDIPTGALSTDSVTIKVFLQRSISPVWTIVNQAGPTSELSLTQTAGTFFNFTTATGNAFNMGKTEFQTAEVSTFLYLSKVFEYAVQQTQSWNPPLDLEIWSTQVNKTTAAPVCNTDFGAYGTGTIFLWKERTCSVDDPSGHATVRNAAYSTIIYHEFGHHFSKYTAGLINAYTDEFVADIMSAFYRNGSDNPGDPILGKDLFTNRQGVTAPTYGRDISELWFFPLSSGDGHDPGRPFSGSFWSLRSSLMAAEGSAQGADTAQKLFFEMLRLWRSSGTQPALGPQVFLDVLQADVNKFPGNSHLTQIEQAFGSHGIVPFLRGDANSDGNVDISDVGVIFDHLYSGLSIPCHDAADTDDSGTLNITDGIYLRNYLFYGGPPPPAPFPACGGDETQDSLTCTDGGCH